MAPLGSSLFVLICCIFLYTGRIQGQSGYNDDGEGLYSGGEESGSGASGSGDDMKEGDEGDVGTESELAECVDVLHREDDEGDELTSSTAYNASMCSVLCMDSITNSQHYQDVQLENVTAGGGLWVFKSFPQFSSENEKTNCKIYQKFAECVRGCLVRVEPTSAQLTRRGCRDECKVQCKDERKIDDHYFNPYCRIDCNATVCRQGCDNYERIVRSFNAAGSPQSPVQAPQLVFSTLLGDVILSISESAPPPNDQEHTPAPVGIVYRVVDQTTNYTRYFQTVYPDEPLSLEDFACRTVSVSFVVVNKFGVSQESPPLTLNVLGGEIELRAPTDIDVEEGVDKRPGFFGHAVLSISWTHPQDYVEGLHYYIVKVARRGSGGKQLTSSPIMSNSLTVSDNETGLGVFLLDYNVVIEVCTRMWGEDSSEECEEEPKSLSTVAYLEKPMVVTHCVPHWNGLDFDFTIHWTVQEFVAYGNEIFIGFLVVIEDRIAKRFIRSNDVNKIANQTEYSYKWFNLPPLEKDTTYKFTVSIQWQSSDSYKQPSVFDASCTRPAVPPPSSPVLDVRLSEFEFSEETMEVQFRVEWNPPTTPNGQITHYLACLGGRNIPNFEEGPGDVKDGNDTTCQNIDKEKRSFVWKTRLPRPDCIYFQMRAHTKLTGDGSWSEAVIISDKDISKTNTCSTPPSFEPLQAQRESPESSATYVPVLGGLGAVIGLTLLALLVALTVVCGRIRRRKRRIQHVLARQMSDEMDLMFTGGAKKSLSSRKELLITADEWEIPPEQVIVEGNIGEGAFGEVLKGAVKGPLSNPKVPRALKSSICIPVAIKMLKTSAKGGERRDFLSEIEMMKKVSAGQNPHVVSMVGCVTVQEPLSLITEFVPYGNLLQYLRTNQRLYTDRTEGDEEDMTTTYTDLGNIISTDLISFAYQIASGMEYLSSLGIVHRDVACRNILVGEDKVLKITDLGMSRETDEVYVQKTKGRVPLKWMAVESIITREFTSASDVWAYGVVLWEIGTLGGFPYPTIQNEDLLPLLKRGYRLEKPDNCSSDVYAIMLECWQEDPGKRPTFTGLRARFDSMLLAEKKDTYIDLQIDASKPYYNPDLASDAEILDNLLNAGKLAPNTGKMVSATSPFHLRGISPPHSDFTDSPASQRSPRSQSPVQLPEKPPGGASLQPQVKEQKNVYVDNPSVAQHNELQVTLRDRSPATGQGGARPASLQLVTGNRNVYVDTPSGRRSVHVTSPPDWSSSGYYQVSENVPVAGINLNGAGGWGGVDGGANETEGQGGNSTMPEILISLT